MAAILKAGEDLDCGDFILKNLDSAVRKGVVTDVMVKRALKNMFSVLFRLGYFDPTAAQPLKALNANDVNTQEAKDVALDAPATV